MNKLNPCPWSLLPGPRSQIPNSFLHMRNHTSMGKIMKQKFNETKVNIYAAINHIINKNSSPVSIHKID